MRFGAVGVWAALACAVLPASGWASAASHVRSGTTRTDSLSVVPQYAVHVTVGRSAPPAPAAPHSDRRRCGVDSISIAFSGQRGATVTAAGRRLAVVSPVSASVSGTCSPVAGHLARITSGHYLFPKSPTRITCTVPSRIILAVNYYGHGRSDLQAAFGSPSQIFADVMVDGNRSQLQYDSGLCRATG